MEGVQLNKNVLPADAILVAKDRWSELYQIGKKFIAVGPAEKGKGYLVGLAKPTMQDALSFLVRIRDIHSNSK